MSATHDLDMLRQQLFTLDDTRRALAVRLERVVKALALTLDAQASTQQRIDSSTTNGRSGDHGRWEALQRQREAERYRIVLGLLLIDGEDSANAFGGGGRSSAAAASRS